jgi:hypothetical protein
MILNFSKWRCPVYLLRNPDLQHPSPDVTFT